ncbi:hypothetical protein D3C71_2201470 [compost metagenome]
MFIYILTVSGDHHGDGRAIEPDARLEDVLPFQYQRWAIGMNMNLQTVVNRVTRGQRQQTTLL